MITLPESLVKNFFGTHWGKNYWVFGKLEIFISSLNRF